MTKKHTQPGDDQDTFKISDRDPEVSDKSTDHPGSAPTSALQQERDDLEQRLLRVSADYQNFIRRSEQNLQSTRHQTLIDVAKALLTPLDHFDHALDLDPQTTTAEALQQGVLIVRDELIKALDQFGIARIYTEPGDEFDPNRHEALIHQPSPGIEEGRIASQLQPGYSLDQTTIRPAKVAIAQSPSTGSESQSTPTE